MVVLVVVGTLTPNPNLTLTRSPRRGAGVVVVGTPTPNPSLTLTLTRFVARNLGDGIEFYGNAKTGQSQFELPREFK